VDFVYQRESSIGREATLTTAANYTRPTRLLYCVIGLSEVVSLNYTIVGGTVTEEKTGDRVGVEKEGAGVT